MVQSQAVTYILSKQLLLFGFAWHYTIYLVIMWPRDRAPSKYDIMNQCCYNAGPSSATLDQHFTSIGKRILSTEGYSFHCTIYYTDALRHCLIWHARHRRSRLYSFLHFVLSHCTSAFKHAKDKTWHKPTIFKNSWSFIRQIWIIFTHLKLWIASARHNFKCAKIPIE